MGATDMDVSGITIENCANMRADVYEHADEIGRAHV